MEKKLSREEAWALLTEYNESPSLLNHALTVEAVMEHFARINGEDEEVWGVTGLLHDLDYEKYPEEHCIKAEEIMTRRGIDPIYIRAMKCHGYGICTDTEPESLMEKVLYTIDELTGLIHAACLMRPSKSGLASFQEHQGHGTEISEKEIQGQAFRCGSGQGHNTQGLRDAGDGAGRCDPRDHRRNERKS